jgi:hypothetical protein
MKNFPAWRYHKDHEPRIFDTPEAIEAAEADGWVDSPAKLEGDQGEPKAKHWSQMNKAELVAFCAAAGIALAEGMTNAQIKDAIRAAGQE